MIKAELRKLRMLNATDKMIRMVAENDYKNEAETSQNKSSYYYIYNKYGVFIRCQYFSGILKAALFFPEDLKQNIITPTYEIFLNIQGNQYVTRELDESGQEIRWSRAMVCNLDKISMYQYRYHCKYISYLNAGGRRNIKTYLEAKKGVDALSAINVWQKKVHDKKKKEAEIKEKKCWDMDMELVPETPKDFDRWLYREAQQEHFIFYTYNRSRVKEGYCTFCEKTVQLKEIPKHRNRGICPKCKKKIIYLCRGKLKKTSTQNISAQIIQLIPDGFVVRIFQTQTFHNLENMKLTSYVNREIERLLYVKSEIRHYVWAVYKNQEYRWCRKKDGYGYYCNTFNTPIYHRNLKRIEPAISKMSALPIIIKNKINVSVEYYLFREKIDPVIEQIIKTGMIDLGLDIIKRRRLDSMNICVDERQTELPKKLYLDKFRLDRLRKMNPKIEHLLWLQLEKRNNTIYPDELVRYFSDQEMIPESFDFISSKMSYMKIYNYLQKQSILTKDNVMHLVIAWRDYLNMAEKQKMDITKELIYKPKNINEAHTQLIELENRKNMEDTVKKVKKKFPDVDKICKELGKYEWTDGTYMVVAPEGIYDIVREGTILKHCIHTCDYYFDRISNRESYLLFLRLAKSPETPWYTMEVEPSGNIRQKRTVGDNQNKDFEAAVPFIQKWQQIIRKRISEEDKKLAEISEAKRKENYANLRKSGNRIWHGKLKGQLLADVLENDLMEVINKV